MAANLERLAADLEKRDLRPLATIARGLAEAVREVGVPEHFDEASDKTTAHEELRIPLMSLVEALSFREKGGKNNSLTSELAQHFNESLGSSLHDDIPLRNLLYPSAQYRIGLSVKDSTKEALVGRPLITNYTRILKVLIRRGYRTVGELRSVNIQDLTYQYDLGEKSIMFLMVAFKPKSEG